MRLLDVLGGLVAPPRCAACGKACEWEEALCVWCARSLAMSAPLCGRGAAGLDRAWSSALHEGVARDLVTALKLRRLLPVARLMAERIDRLAPPGLLSGAIVPVPTSSLRFLRRGFDPTRELALALGERSGLAVHPCLARRGGGRQVGRRRAERVGDPPRIFAAEDVPRSAVLLDDVLTTGATLSACAAALRRGGAARVVAVTFARRL